MEQELVRWNHKSTEAEALYAAVAFYGEACTFFGAGNVGFFRMLTQQGWHYRVTVPAMDGVNVVDAFTYPKGEESTSQAFCDGYDRGYEDGINAVE